jgi:PhnB protein
MLSTHRAPDRYRHAVLAHVMVPSAAAALEFYRRAFGAIELMRITAPDGRVLHAETSIQGAVVMVGDADGVFAAPDPMGGASVALHVYVDDVDACHAQAVATGAASLQPAQEMFYGARTSMVRDPFGHVWVLLTHREDLELDVITQRGEALLTDADQG